MDPIRLTDPTGRLLARDSWVVAFFLPDPFPPHAEAVRAAFDVWRTAVPADALKWALVGAAAEEAKPVGPKTLGQCAAMLDPAKAAKRDITAFAVYGPRPDTPDHRFHAVGERAAGVGFAANMVGLAEVWLPTEGWRAADVAAFAGKLADQLPYLSGYAAPALAFGPAVDVHAAGRAVRGPAFRHPGYDVPRNEATRFYLGGKLIGARWLTFLGPALADQLGGRDALTAAAAGVTVAPAGHGFALRAGDEPEIGDTNRRVGTPMLRAVAQAVEPVTLFGNRALEPVFGDDPDALDRWERRFLS
jgi:hypothetical protein